MFPLSKGSLRNNSNNLPCPLACARRGVFCTDDLICVRTLDTEHHDGEPAEPQPSVRRHMVTVISEKPFGNARSPCERQILPLIATGIRSAIKADSVRIPDKEQRKDSSLVARMAKWEDGAQSGYESFQTASEEQLRFLARSRVAQRARSDLAREQGVTWGVLTHNLWVLARLPVSAPQALAA